MNGWLVEIGLNVINFESMEETKTCKLTLAFSVADFNPCKHPGKSGTNFILVTKERLPDNLVATWGKIGKSLFFLVPRKYGSILASPEVIQVEGEEYYSTLWSFGNNNLDEIIPNFEAGTTIDVSYAVGDPKLYECTVTSDSEVIDTIASMIQEEKKSDKKTYKRLARQIFKMLME